MGSKAQEKTILLVFRAEQKPVLQVQGQSFSRA